MPVDVRAADAGDDSPGGTLRVSDRRTVLRAAALLGGAALVTACGDDGGNGPRGPTETTPTTSTPSKITLTDQRGKTIQLDGPATRVVTVPIPAASMLIAIDKSANPLVGMQDASWSAIRDGIMGKMFPAALHVTHDVADEEFAPNVESILSLDPDVVVQWGDHGDQIITPLENAGLTVVGLSYGTQADLEAWIRLFAAMLGKPERGRAMLAGIHHRLRAAQSTGAARRSAGAVAPKVLYFLRYADGLQVAGTDTYNDYYISLVGATNPAGGKDPVAGFATVDIEQVLSWDPDIVLLGNFDTAMPGDIYSDRVWQGVSAVRTKRVYKVPFGGYRWDPPGQESPLMWQWLSDVVYPQPAGSRVRTEIMSSYDFLYGYSPSPSEIDDILWNEPNSASADYGQFGAG